MDSADSVVVVDCALERRVAARLSSSTRVLVVGVGGDNDSVTTLLLKYQLEEDFAFDLSSWMSRRCCRMCSITISSTPAAIRWFGESSQVAGGPCMVR